MSSESSPTSSPLPPPQGYVAEKVSILMGALRSVLRRVGLVVHTVDDSLVPVEDKLAEPSSQDLAHVHSPFGDVAKLPGLHTIGQKLEHVLHESAEFKDSHAMQVAQEAREEDRLQRRISM